jgi:fatty acid desaturase
MNLNYRNEYLLLLFLITTFLLTLNKAWMTPINFVIIGIVQYHFVLILHECIHETFFKSKSLNRIIGTLVGAIVFISYRNYQKEHKNHHYNTGTLEDPDFYIYKNEAPLTSKNFITHFFIGGIKEAIKKQRTKGILSERRFGNLMFIICIQFLIFSTLFLLSNNILTYLYLWCLPIFFVAFYINRLRINFEHGFGSFNIIGNNIEVNKFFKLIIFGYNFDYHYTHHKFPQAEAYLLPEIALNNDHKKVRLKEILISAQAKTEKKSF